MNQLCLTLREAVPADSSLLSALAFRSKSYWGYPTEFMEACRAELSYSKADIESESLTFVLAEWAAELAGFCAIEESPGSVFELDALFVEPALMRHGIGRALIAHAKAHVLVRGGHTLIIQGDPNAEAFYLACGARPVGHRESASIPGRMLPMFELDVT